MSTPLMVRPEVLAMDLSGKIYVVTGANSGIGLVTTQQLARQGATVVMGVRRVQEGERVATEIRRELPSARLAIYQLELGDLASVRAFAGDVNRHHPTLQGLVNNAGVMNTPFGRTRDGFETQFGVNHLGHFLLTELLTGALKAGAPSRVVNLEPWEGTQTSLHALLAPEVDKQSGAYYSQVAGYKDKASRSGGWPLSSPNPVAHDDDVAARLWSASEALVQA